MHRSEYHLSNNNSFVVGSPLLISALLMSGNNVMATESDYFELYAKVHLSIDMADDGQEDMVSLSNNSSRFGLQGKHLINSKTEFLWRMEQKVYMDESEGRFGNPAYAGFEGRLGRILAGFIDTPYKSFVSKFNVMDDTVADVRSILGYSPLGAYETVDVPADNMNVRARNAVFYDRAWSDYRVALLYSMEKGDDGTASGLDDNDNAGISGSFEYATDKIKLGMAAENWGGGQELQGIRIGGRYEWRGYDFGLVWEQIDSSINPDYCRDAHAFDVGFNLDEANRLKIQYLTAESSEGLPDSSARMLSIGSYHKLDSAMSLYLIATSLENDVNAEYRLGTSGHGDIIAPLAGDDIWAVSFGLIYKVAKQFKLP